MNSNSFNKGDVIFKDGDKGNDMYIIKSGKVEIVKKINDEEVVLAQLEPPSFFGEMALFGSNLRSATVRATEPTELAEIGKAYLDLQLRKAPDWFVAIMRTLVIRLIDTNKKLKSRYPVNLEYSLLTLLHITIKTIGTFDTNRYVADLSKVTRSVESILSVSHEEVMQKLKDFSFIQMLKFSEETNEIFLPDEKKLKTFLLFLRGKQIKKVRMTHDFEALQSDSVKMQYFEKIYRLLSRRKDQ